MREQIELALLMPTVSEVIAAGGSFRLYPRGTSMQPMLTEGEDSVSLVAAESYRVGDVLLYRRENGQFVLHRLIGAVGDTLVFCGDNQNAPEFGIPRHAVLAKLGGYYKGDAYHTLDEPDYLRYAEARVSRFPRLVRKSPRAARLYRHITPLRTLPRRAARKLLRMLKLQK